jgi:hypothetical protein
MFGVNTSAGPPPLGAVSGTGKPCRVIPFPITPGGWAGKVLETPPPVEFSIFWVGGWEMSWYQKTSSKAVGNKPSETREKHRFHRHRLPGTDFRAENSLLSF